MKPESERLESTVYIAVRRSTRRRMERICRARGISLAGFARQAIEHELERENGSNEAHDQ